jgi:hypothetical protein
VVRRSQEARARRLAQSYLFFKNRYHSPNHASPTGVRGESNPRLDGHGVACRPLHHGHSASARIRTWTTCLEDRHDVRFTTEAAGRNQESGIRNQGTAPTPDAWFRFPIPLHSTPTRTRTRNPSFEARNDLRFTIGAKAEGKGVEPSSPAENRLSRAARPTVSGYLPEWTHRESNPDFQSAELVSSRWTMSPPKKVSGTLDLVQEV